MVTTSMLETDGNIMYFKLLSHKLDLANKYAQTAYPLDDKTHMTENEYREFLSQFGSFLNH